MKPRRREIDPKALEKLTIDAMCVEVGMCNNCPINAAMRKRAMDCVQFQERYPDEALQLAKKWRKENAGGILGGSS